VGAASEAFLEVRFSDILLDKLRGCKVDDDDVEGLEAAEVTVEVAEAELAMGHRLGFCGKLATGMCFEEEACAAAGAHISSP